MSKISEIYNKIRSAFIDALSASGPSKLFFYDPQYEIRNLKWRIHNDDVDTFPSIPHLHSKEKALKLDVYTGRIYDIKTKKHLYSASMKDMKKLWTDKKMVSIIMGYRERYASKLTLPDIPSYAVVVSKTTMSDNEEQYEISFQEENNYAE